MYKWGGFSRCKFNDFSLHLGACNRRIPTQGVVASGGAGGGSCTYARQGVNFQVHYAQVPS